MQSIALDELSSVKRVGRGPGVNGDPVLYNTLSREKEPVTETRIGLYVCGVTPYDTTHLGHAFTYTSFDVLVRYLRFLGREVTYVRNITDIDDDILLRAGIRDMDWKELGDREYAKFVNDMVGLNNLDAGARAAGDGAYSRDRRDRRRAVGERPGVRTRRLRLLRRQAVGPAFAD